MKVYTLETGAFADRKVMAFTTREKVMAYMEKEIEKLWEKYSGDPEYRNAKLISFDTYEAFRADRLMDFETRELEVY